MSEHGYCRCFLTQYWRTSYRFPLDKELRSKVVYLRYFERTTQGVCKLGERVPDIPLVDLRTRSTCSLLGDFVRGRPLVVMAGSQS